MEHPKASSRVARVRHESKRRDVEVVRVDLISENFRSVTFAGESLIGFRSDGFDDHVKFILETDGGEIKRDYTPRRFNPMKGELTIEFSLHGDGVVSNWAATVLPGQHAIIAGPRSSLIVPTDYAWHLLIGDDTALPAVARRLEELPSNTVAKVLLLVSDRADRRLLKSRSVFNVTWVHSAQELLTAVREFHLPSGNGFAWCAAEAAIASTIREILVDLKGHDANAIRAAAYWRHAAAAQLSTDSSH
jgi:NADPH-dependent ferric siderophore reductase